MRRAEMMWNNKIGPQAGGYSNRIATNLNSRDVTFQNRIYGMENGHIGNIDMSKPSKLFETARAANWARDSMFNGPKEFVNQTRNSNIEMSRLGLGHSGRPTLANQESQQLRNVLGIKETSFSNPSSSNYNGSLYDSFVRGSDNSNEHDYDWDYNDTPDYRSLHSVGTQTTPSQMTRGIQVGGGGSRDTNTQTFAGSFDNPSGRVDGIDDGARPGTSRSSEAIQSDFSRAGGMDFTGTSAPSARTGAPAAASAAASADPSGIASAVGQKIGDISNGAADIYNQHQNAKNLKEYQNRTVRPGMMSRDHADKWMAQKNAQGSMTNSYMNMGNTLFGIPGMIGGYFLGKHIAQSSAGPKDLAPFRNANSAYGRINPQQTAVVNSMSAAQNVQDNKSDE